MLISLPAAVIGSYAVPKNPGISDLLALWIWVAYTGINSVNQFLVHSNLRANYGWVGRWLIVSPANHRVHHSIQPEHLGKNFSVTLVLWDRVFGTFHEGDLDCKIGYEGNIYNRSRLIVDEYFYPLVAFLSGLWKILRVRMATKANRGAFASAYPGVAVRMTEKDRQRP
jgi:sterol desaturase/sphingolipid hydroxylase (fatty acid hydroxylase superfamily)